MSKRQRNNYENMPPPSRKARKIVNTDSDNAYTPEEIDDYGVPKEVNKEELDNELQEIEDDDYSDDDEEKALSGTDSEEEDENGKAIKKKNEKIVHAQGEDMNSRNKDEDGEELEPFNLRQEMDEGYFDQSGNYIRRRIIKTQDEIDNPDEFLDNIDKMEIYQPKETIEEEDDLTPFNKISSLEQLLNILQDDDETPSHRMKKLKGQKINKDKKNNSQLLSFLPSAIKKEEREEEIKESQNLKVDIETFNKLIDIVDRLVMEGNLKDLYEMTKSEIRENYINELVKTVKPEIAKIQWKYKWNKNDKEIYGPFYTVQMLKWKLVGGFDFDPLVQKCSDSSSPTPHTTTNNANNGNDLLDDLKDVDNDDNDDDKWIKSSRIDFVTGNIL